MDLETLRARLAEIDAERQALDTAALSRAEGQRDFTAEEQTRWEALTTEHGEVAERIAQAEEVERRAANVAESRERWRSTQVQTRTPSVQHEDVSRLTGRQAVDRVRSTLDNEDVSGHLAAPQRSYVSRLVRTQTANVDGEALARYILATMDPHYRAGFAAKAAGDGDLMTSEEARAIRQVRQIKRAMSIGSASAGGDAVPALIDPTIIMTAQGSPNDILRLARVETITNDTWRGLASAGVSWSWHAEAAATTDNSPTISKPEVATHRTDGFIPFSIEVSMDWQSFAENMAMMLGEGYHENLASVLTNGTNGSNEPDGLIAELDATAASEVEVATAGTIAAPDIYGLWAALPARWRRAAAAAWMSSTDVQNSVRQLGTTDPNFSVDITAEGIARMFNREYPVNDYMQDDPSGTGTQPLLVVGDFRQYLVAQRAGMTVELVPHLFDVTNNRPTGQRGYFAWARLGGGVLVTDAFRLLVNRSA